MCRILILVDIRPKLWGISFHAVVVFGLGKNLLFKSIPGRCDTETETAICNYIAAWFLLKNIFSASKLGQSFRRSKNLQGQNSKIIAELFL